MHWKEINQISLGITNMCDLGRLVRRDSWNDKIIEWINFYLTILTNILLFVVLLEEKKGKKGIWTCHHVNLPTKASAIW